MARRANHSTAAGRASMLDVALLVGAAALAASMAAAPKAPFVPGDAAGAQEQAQRNLASRFDSLAAIY